MSNKITLQQAFQGFVFYKQAIGLSPHTISDYHNTYKKLVMFIPETIEFEKITHDTLIEFFAWLQNDYISNPDGVAPRKQKPLSQKSILNIHTNLSSLWTWAVNEGYATSNIVHTIERPHYSPPVVDPFDKDEISALLKACKRTRSWKNNKVVSSSRPTEHRDQAIILMLLDTGIRASELCEIRFADVDMQKRRVKIFGKGAGNSKKERMVPFSPRTAGMLNKYIQPRIGTFEPDDFIFTVGRAEENRPMNRHTLRKTIKRLGDKAGVPKAYPHHFRHTFGRPFGRLVNAS
jgi:integrase/recombinase XerD